MFDSVAQIGRQHTYVRVYICTNLYLIFFKSMFIYTHIHLLLVVIIWLQMKYCEEVYVKNNYHMVYKLSVASNYKF